jgi:CRP-like cAMP-binding protein
MTLSGRRQITSFHVPGDVIDFQSMHLPVMDHGILPAVAVRVARISHATLSEAFASSPELSRLFYKDAFIDSAIFREWVVNVGARDAVTRTAHLLCEVVTKMKAVGLCDGLVCDLPLTQQVLADAAGLSMVHMNRSLQFLRKMKLITFRDRVLDVIDWEGLNEAGDFDPSYLHLRQNDAGVSN